MFYELLTKYWVALLFFLFVSYQVFDYFSFKNLLNGVGRDYCAENSVEFVGIKHAKSHFSVIYKKEGSGKRMYKKFRMDAFLGKIKHLEWLA